MILQGHLEAAGGSQAAMANAFGTTFIWVMGITAVALLPTLVLTPRERAAALAELPEGSAACSGPSAGCAVAITTVPTAGDQRPGARAPCLGVREEATAGQIAEAARLSPASVTGMLDELEREGVVTRVLSAEDRRRSSSS